MRGRVACAAIVLVASVAATGARAQGPSVATARELYASAAYEDSLQMLDSLLSTGPSDEDLRTIGFYRVLCLTALARTTEAEQALESLVRKQPLYRPPTDDLAPRIRTTFVEARTRLLPGIIQQQYRDAKAAYDREEFGNAAAAFAVVLEALADPVMADAASQPPLADLRTLAKGFHDLSVEAAAPAPVLLPAPAPVVVIAAPPSPPARDFRRVYTVDDADVVLPTAEKQTLPPFAGRVFGNGGGIIDVLIDAMGNVEKVTMREPIDPRYDSQLLAAAQRWQYKPATVEGVPVKFLKSVRINLSGERR